MSRLAMHSVEATSGSFRETGRALFASQSGLRFSQSMCSQATQDSFDFCTPVDQPVEHTGVVPESPSPAKKRTRRVLAGGSQVDDLAQEFHDTGARGDPPARARVGGQGCTGHGPRSRFSGAGVTPSPRFRIRSRLTPDVRGTGAEGDARGGEARQEGVPAPQCVSGLGPAPMARASRHAPPPCGPDICSPAPGRRAWFPGVIRRTRFWPWSRPHRTPSSACFRPHCATRPRSSACKPRRPPSSIGPSSASVRPRAPAAPAGCQARAHRLRCSAIPAPEPPTAADAGLY